MGSGGVGFGTFRYGLAIAPEQQRHGFGSEALLLTLRHYSRELRRMVYTHGQYFDQLVYGLTAEEFAARYVDLV